MRCSRTCSRRGGAGRSVPADVMATRDHVAGVARVVGQRDRGCGHVRSAVEGGVWAAGDRGGVSSDDVDLLAAAVGGLGSARTGSSRRSRRWSPQTGALAGKTRRALDSTVLDDAVATQDTVTQLIARDPAGAPRGARCGAR